MIEKFRASGFEPEGYTLYAYASIQLSPRPGTPSVPITPKPATG
ncbi:Branched-chain amino acid ABC transporter, amino acid-binding protein (TC 3.A.1.4.1) [Klebsiella pneumoniae IS53]|nr:Branched-chain amino acid ABC transporter, amino acid-binding protein (TC 3.A.1.4.1) [Klebsiella pneumoniae IS53]